MRSASRSRGKRCLPPFSFVWDGEPAQPAGCAEPDGAIKALSASDGAPGPPPPNAPCHSAFAPLTPRPWQQEALASLAAIRRDGYSKALVAVATGLGKTWLAAFDVIAVGRELGRPPPVFLSQKRFLTRMALS